MCRGSIVVCDSSRSKGIPLQSSIERRRSSQTVDSGEADRRAECIQICSEWRPKSGISDQLAEAVRELVLLAEAEAGAPRRKVLKPANVVCDNSGSAFTPRAPDTLAMRGRARETVGVLQSLVFSPLCDLLSTLAKSGMSGETGWETPLTRDVLLVARDAADLLHWVCQRRRISAPLCECCEEHHIVQALSLLCARTPADRGAIALPLMRAIRSFVCNPAASESLRELHGEELLRIGFVDIVAFRIEGWVQLSGPLGISAEEVCQLLGSAGDIIREVFRQEQVGPIIVDEGLVPALKDLLQNELWLWPRVVTSLVDAISTRRSPQQVTHALKTFLSRPYTRCSTCDLLDIKKSFAFIILCLSDLQRAQQSQEHQAQCVQSSCLSSLKTQHRCAPAQSTMMTRVLPPMANVRRERSCTVARSRLDKSLTLVSISRDAIEGSKFLRPRHLGFDRKAATL